MLISDLFAVVWHGIVIHSLKVTNIKLVSVWRGADKMLLGLVYMMLSVLSLLWQCVQKCFTVVIKHYKLRDLRELMNSAPLKAVSCDSLR